jgi:hypothetical protein
MIGLISAATASVRAEESEFASFPAFKRYRFMQIVYVAVS